MVLLVLPAEAAPGAVGVAAVNFRAVMAPNGSGAAWYEADVELEARPPADGAGRALSRVKVALDLSTETTLAAGARREYYQASAEAVALEAGRYHVRFYLPPEIAKRDAVRGAAREWAVEVTVAGKVQPAAPAAVAPALRDAAARAAFRARIAAAAPANDGIIQPQYLTPFVSEYPRDTPSFVRHN